MFTGHWELLLIAFVILILFGNRLPNVMRSLGRGVVEFKRGVKGIDEESDSVNDSNESPGVS